MNAGIEPSQEKRERCHHKLIPCAVSMIAVFFLQTSLAFGIDIEDYKWGFNGKVASHRFNLLSVLFNNPASQTFKGDVVLSKSLGTGGMGVIDAPLIETIEISPNSKKWVQFYPYITSDVGSGFVHENWSIKYPGGTKDFQPAPKLAKYQRVILEDPQSISSKGGGMKFRFRDDLFPPYVTATDALQLVVIDHDPRWEESRRQSFIDWAWNGGTVVVLHDISGKFPDFTGPLSFLKSPLDDQVFGSGRVIKIPRLRGQFSEEDLRQICAGLPKNFVQRNDTEKSDDVVDRIDESEQLSQTQQYGYNEGHDPFKSALFLGQLKQITKPEHNWLLLHFLFWIYIGIVFPGCYLLGKRWSDFRVVYAGLLGAVTVFSLLFSYVGQRGYDEASAVHTVAIAKPLPGGFMDVSSWSHVFVTNGADYDIQHNASGALYSTCNDTEAVRGEINNGNQGLFKVDIPPFSHREFAARAKIPFNGLTLSLLSIKSIEGRLSELEIAVQGVKPEDVEEQYVLIGSSFYGLKWNGDKLELGLGAGNATTMLKIQEQRNNNMYNYNPYGDNSKFTTSERYSKMFLSLMSRSQHVGREKEAEMLRLPPNTLRVFLFAKIPVDFAIQSNRLGKQDGRVLYCVTLSETDLKQP